MDDLQELYQEIVMDHNWKPRNFREIERADRSADGFNPFCGDTITLYLTIENDVINDVAFQGSGCAISRASASMMTESVKGNSLVDAEKKFEAFHEMLTGGGPDNIALEILGDLEILAGVSEFPTRVKCATLSWHTLKGALAGEKHISTE